MEVLITISLSESFCKPERCCSGSIGECIIEYSMIKKSLRCRVSGLSSEAEAEARMLVYSPVQEMEFIQRRLSG